MPLSTLITNLVILTLSLGMGMYYIAVVTAVFLHLQPRNRARPNIHPIA